MWKNVWLILIIAALPASNLLAQERGKLEVVEDPLITILQQFRAGKLSARSTEGSEEVHVRTPGTRTVARGFRVQIYMGSSRSDAYAAQARFQRAFSDIETYVTYEQPNFRVKVGDFRSRSEAEQLMRGLRQQFNNVFVHTEDIFIYY